MMLSPFAPADRLFAVEADLDRIAGHLIMLRDELAHLREADAVPRALPTPTAPFAPTGSGAAAPIVPAAPSAAVPRTAAIPAPAGAVGPPAPPRTPWWQREGAVSRLLSIAGAGVFLIGISLLLLLAIQHGYLGPVTRVVLGWVASAALVGIGLLVHRRRPTNPGSIALAATGIAGGYLLLLAQTTVYGWLGVSAGLGLAGVVFAGGVLLTRRWSSEVLGVIVVFGVVGLAPAVGADSPWIAAAFLVAVSLGAIVADLGRRWTVLRLVRVISPAVVLMGLSGVDAVERELLILAAVASAFSLVTLLAELMLDRRAPRGPAAGGGLVEVLGALTAGIGLLPAIVVTVMVTDGMVTTIWLAAVGLAVLVLVPVAAGPGTRAVLLSMAALSVVASLASTEVEWLWVPGALVLAAGYLGAAVATRRWMVGWVGVGIAGVGLLGYLAVVPGLLDPELNVLDEPLGIWELMASAAGLAVVWLAARMIDSLRPGGLGRVWPFVLWAAGLVLITGVTVSAGVMIGAAVRQPASGFLAGHAAATLTWMAAAVWLLMSRQRDGRQGRQLGMVIAGAAVAKLLLFDLGALDGVSGVVAFVVAGAALLAVGTLYRQTRKSV